MCKIVLSEKQSEIVNFTKGPLLVTASAGSGKTRVLTERICNLSGLTRRRILAITFTNKACEEIRSRIEAKDSELLDKVLVATFHGFCMQVLESHVAAMNWQTMPQIFRDDDLKHVVTSAICSEPRLNDIYIQKDSKDRIAMVNEAMNVISRIKREVIMDDELESRINNVLTIKIYKSYCDFMNNFHAIDFDDLLLDAYKLFLFNPKIAADYRREFEYICVDEAQDMNKAQYQLLRILTGKEHRNVMLVGDSKQSIYAFNGSSSTYMLCDFPKDYDPITKIELLENYRSAKKILDYAKKIIPDAPVEEYIKLDGICEENTYDTPCKEANGVVEKIKSLIDGVGTTDLTGNVNYSDISVLGRNKFVLSKIERALKEEGIPYYYKNTSGNTEFASTSANVFILALMVKLNDADMLHLTQLRNVLKLKSSTLDKLEKEVCNDFYKMILSSVIKLDTDGSNFYTSVSAIIKYIERQSKDTQIDKQEWIMAYDDFKEIKNHWVKYASSVNNTNLSAFRNAMALGQTSMQKNVNSVALATVHTMKGQQSTIVFLVGMDEGTFPDYRAVKKGFTSVEMEQERNNLYVAITRAQRHLYISFPTTRTMPWGDESKRRRSSLLPKMVTNSKLNIW